MFWHLFWHLSCRLILTCVLAYFPTCTSDKRFGIRSRVKFGMCYLHIFTCVVPYRPAALLTCVTKCVLSSILTVVPPSSLPFVPTCALTYVPTILIWTCKKVIVCSDVYFGNVEHSKTFRWMDLSLFLVAGSTTLRCCSWWALWQVQF